MHTAHGEGRPEAGRPPRLIWVVLLGLSFGPAYADSGFDFAAVQAKAQALAKKPYEAPQAVPKLLTDLSAQEWGKFSFKPEKSLWRGEKLRFEVQFFHPGYNYRYPVNIHVVNEYGVGRLEFSRDRFVYPNSALRDKLSDDLGYAGFRLHYPINQDGAKQEFAVFLGASYFRGVGKGQVYGLSARGLAIDTGADSGEEFPRFTDFWLRQPKPEDQVVEVFALLDSPSITGAYRFEIKPGEATVMNVDARLYPRTKINKLGVAPLTSMFMFGENSDREFHDYRPEVHDSDGLLLASGQGEWLWRPLLNPPQLTINSFAGDSPRGFGLLQRDREFDHYQDIKLRYGQRPSAWVEPVGDWGGGRVELVQIPSNSEKNDNMVAFWRPSAPVTPKESLRFRYRILWSAQSPEPPGVSRVRATRVGYTTGSADGPRVRKVVVDFAGGALARLDENAVVVPRLDIGEGGKLNEVHVVKSELTGGWRLSFEVANNQGDQPLELRAFLADDKGGALTQTWSYTLPP